MTMRYAVSGKCYECGAKNEWKDPECHGCHMKRRPFFGIFVRVAGTILLMTAWLGFIAE